MVKRLFFILLLSQTSQAAVVNNFVVPEGIAGDVEFWKTVYQKWDTHQVIFYDGNSKVIYDVLNLPKVDNELSSVKYKKVVDTRAKEISAILKLLDERGKLPVTPLSLKIQDVVKKHALTADTDLLKRLHRQNGLRSRFEYGLKISGRYADDMKAVLKSQNLPDDLIAIVFVESLFHLTAISSAGAAGPWGIVRETAIRQGIHVNNFADERIDPVVATWAAAQFLRKAKEGLTEWPLAIMAYNYGYAGVMRAANNFGKDYEAIIANHESPIFGYAVRSYYPTFLAALDTWRNQAKLFPNVAKETRWKYELVQVQRPVVVDDMITVNALSHDDLAKLNPSLTKRTLTGNEVIPALYSLRVPAGGQQKFYERMRKISESKRQAAHSKISTKYTANGKRSLYEIAKQLGISAEELGTSLEKPLSYRPKGAVNIRSRYNRYFSLLTLNEDMLKTLATGQVLERPAEIGVLQP